jgi:hypothetical protein
MNRDDDMSFESWWELRNMVMEASLPPYKFPSDSLPQHLATDLVRKFIETHDESALNEAAKLVAMLKPEVDPATAENEYWLVLDKS